MHDLSSKKLSIGELALALDAQFLGDKPGVYMRGVATLQDAQLDQISFLVNPLYRQQALLSQAGVLIVNQADYEFLTQTTSMHSNTEVKAYLVSKNPYALFARIAQYFANLSKPNMTGFIHPTAFISPHTTVPSNCYIGAFCVLESGVTLGSGVRLVSHVHLGKNVVIGADTVIHPMTVIYDECRIGARGIIHGGVVIGSDGFGFAPDFSTTSKEWVKIPQTGRVIIGDDVELGASSTVDRGAMADTIIGNGCKFDNQVQIGHNAKVGDHTVMAGCSGIAGSTELGPMCVIGGYSNFSGHLQIAERTTVSGGTSITKSIKEPGQHFTGVFPFIPHPRWEKNAAIIRGLDKIRQQIKELMNTKKPHNE